MTAAAKAGFSLLEMLIVLAIMAISVAVAVPRGRAVLDQMITHAVFFDFQRQVSDLRRQAYAAQTPVTIKGDLDADPRDALDRQIFLRASWTYRLTRPIVISEGGVCTPATVEVLKAGRSIMHLTMADDLCHFIRQD